MKSTKTAPKTGPDLSPEGKVRQMIALSLCVESVYDADSLDRWPSLDLVEAVVICERALGLGEIDDDKLLACKTIGDLVDIINAPARSQDGMDVRSQD